MAGFYVHIPFCKRRCLYCDFYSTILLPRRGEYVDALLQEITERKKELNEPIKTIYLGGGTPSVLDSIDIFRILRTIGTDDAEEITMEINPGDADLKYLREIRQCGVNRLSIGIQSFKDDLLQLIGRRHSAIQAINAVHMAQEAGFDNISIDLMYALPSQKMSLWEADIEIALRLGVQHISSYGLMYEEGTALTKKKEQGELEVVDEDTENAMYDYLCKRLKKAGYVHYEVSNFALPGYESKHNSSYWNGTPYIGVGAGAHSYLPPVRSWNKSDMSAYIKKVNKGILQQDKETLTEKDMYNEQIMLGLRTAKGCMLSPSVDRRLTVGNYIQSGLLREEEDGRIVATQIGLHILNRIIEDLMI
ncbi:MAG: radical SAM family heme chaperone HemW [Paludibacteraceae bacterium]|nr:radical SAM family heme chaperone HemW [Paludibacteraceae bacterium]